MHRSAPQLMLIVLLLGLVLMRESHQQPLLGMEEKFTNWLAANSTPESVPAPLTLVEIRDSSFENEHPWPWSPLDFALFIEDVLQFKPKAVAIEPVLEWDRDKLPADSRLKYSQFERILHERVLVTPKLVLGAQLGFPEDADTAPPLQPVPVLRKISGSVREVPPFTMIERQPKEDLRLTTVAGFTNIPADETPIRKAPLLFSYQGQIVPSFVLETMMLWFNATPDDVVVEMGKQIAIGDKTKVPIDASGAVLVNFKTPFARVSYEDLLLAVEQSQASAKPVIDPERIARKVVVLARTDIESRTLDLPIGRQGSPGELLAAAIATLQNEAFIRRIGAWFDAVIIAVMMALSWLLYRVQRRTAIGITVVAFVVYLMTGLVIFASRQLALPLALPLGLAAFVLLFRMFAPKGGLFPETHS